jgi:hypothetical protein
LGILRATHTNGEGTNDGTTGDGAMRAYPDRVGVLESDTDSSCLTVGSPSAP